MKKVMFYCQHILGMGHLVRSIEIVRELLNDFQVCFINGGQAIDGFEAPQSIEFVNIAAIKTDPEFQELQPVDSSLTLEEVQAIRTQQLLRVFERFQPDILIIELFPFGRRRFSFELIPLLEQAKATNTKVVCSLRDILVTKQNQARHEEKICRLINRYFDLLLIHGDPRLVTIETSFSRISDLKCEVYYTGYVTQNPPKIYQKLDKKLLILASIGGGRFGHNLLECVVKAAPILKQTLPHQIQIFTGPFIPEDVFTHLQTLAAHQNNLTINRYTPHLLGYMQQADLSISMSGYNTTMNVLRTGVRAMMLPFIGNGDEEQTIRVTKLAQLRIVNLIRSDDLHPKPFANKIYSTLQQQPTPANFDFNGAKKTAVYLHKLLQKQEAAA